jgi:GT2 family glycosyltransferase
VRPTTTVALVPRETFSNVHLGVEAVAATVPPGTRVVCVDGGAPDEIRVYLERAAREHDFTLLRADRLLTPNEARNLVLPFVDTEFVVFVDYDTETPAGWLERLEDCASATGASIVGPAYFVRIGGEVRPHMVGGRARIVVDDDGTRRFEESHDTDAAALADHRRRPTGQVEFHCMLVRRDVFDMLGPLDEGLRSLAEHSDLCLAVRDRGGTVFVEPGVAVTYTVAPRFSRADRAFWLTRWSDAWNRASVEHLAAKWGLAPDDHACRILLQFAVGQRRACYRGWATATSRTLGRPGRALVNRLDAQFQRRALRRHHARAALAGPPRVVHAASWLPEVTGAR